MRMIREWLQRLAGTIRPNRRDADLAEELRLHAELAAEAGRRAGGSSQALEALRDQRGLPWLDDIVRDVRYGLRVLRRSPVFATVAIVSLALGIGANAAIFHLIDNVRLRSLPVPHPRELAEIRLDGPDAFGSYESVHARATLPLWEQIRSHQQAFSGVFAWGGTQFIVGQGNEARPARGLWVSGEFFPVLGLAPDRGRLLSAADDRPGCGAQAVVISHGFWQGHFGGAESVVGQRLVVLDQPFTIAGVAPRGFTGLEVGQTFDVALPLCSAALFGYTPDQRDRWWLTVMGRLKPGRTLAQAGEHLRTLSPGLLEATVPVNYDKALTDAYRALHFNVIPAGRGVSRLRDAYGPSLLLLLGLTGLVLLITCGNLATLMLARASARHREIAVRAAIGASRRRLVSQMVCESLLVAFAGALVAVPAAVLAGRTLVAFLGSVANPIDLNLTADWRLVAFVAATAVLAAIVFGVIPAWRVSVVDPMAALVARGGTVDRQRARLQRGLVAAQVAVSLVLMVSALMFIQTFRNLATIDTGFAQERTMATWFFDPAAQGFEAGQKVAFQQQLVETIRAVPGVEGAASTTHVPLSGGTWSHFFRVPGAAPEERKASRFAYVDGAYFDTLAIPLRGGRHFSRFDTARSRRVMIVNESFARSHLGGINPVGATVRTAAEADFPETTYEVIGVVGDTKYGDLRGEDCWCDAGSVAMPPIAYVPIAQNPRPYAWSPVIVRLAPGASGVTAAIAAEVARLNPGIAVDFATMRSFVDQRLGGERITAWLAGAFGLLAAVLVVVGLYGLIAYLAARRRSEIGVRLSLGATRAQIVGLVVRDSLLMLGAGVLIGVPIAMAVTHQAEALLFGVEPTDAATIATVVALITIVAAFACWLPAWRASRLDPNAVLRAE